MTKGGNFQCEGSPILQHQGRDNPADRYFQKGTWSMLDPEW